MTVNQKLAHQGMGASTPPEKGLTRIGKLVNKFKSLFRQRSTSEETARTLHTEDTQQSSAPAPERKEDTQASHSQENPEVLMPQLDTMQASAELPSVIEADILDDRDGSQALFAKYNLDIVQPKWPARNNPPVERVPKQIRMRVRYSCHRCLKSFGNTKDCNGCGHRRCANCKRYPPRKSRPNSEPHGAASTPASPVKEEAPKESRPTHSQKLSTCHECQTVLEADVRNCPNCRHTICQTCHIDAQSQKTDGVDVDMRSPTEEATRPLQPEEQKLPPESNTTQEDQAPLPR